MGTPLMLGPAEYTALVALRELAEQHPVDMLKLMPAINVIQTIDRPREH